MQKVLIAVVLSLLAGSVLAEPAQLLVYRVSEPGVAPYISRILVTPDFVRLDEGADKGDFTLLNRERGIIYNVSQGDRSILVIDPPKNAASNEVKLKLAEKITPDAQAPKIGGGQPRNLELLANDKVCSRLVVVPGLMEPALTGLRDLKLVLARVHRATLAGRPTDLQTPCDLASNIIAPTRAVDHGLPIREQDGGRTQTLQDFDPAFAADDSLFELPSDYTHIDMPSL